MPLLLYCICKHLAASQRGCIQQKPLEYISPTTTIMCIQENVPLKSSFLLPMLMIPPSPPPQKKTGSGPVAKFIVPDWGDKVNSGVAA